MQENSNGSVWSYQPVPASALNLYYMAWQLECWLRLFVYVELRAAREEWEDSIKKHANEWPPKSHEQDKKQHHMATHHQASLSYLTFGQLWAIVRAEWELFEHYFPPKENTLARMEEVKTIRNRIAHFREPHRRDETRFRLFMHDMEQGVRRFCKRYTVGRPLYGRNDPFVDALAERWESISYKAEMQLPNGDWLYSGQDRMNPDLNTALDLLYPVESSSTSRNGLIYRIDLRSRRNTFNTVEFMVRTRSIHAELIHILAGEDGVAVTFPATHGTEKCVRIAEEVLKTGQRCLRWPYGPSIDGVRQEWPEYVIWPDNILYFFSEEIQNPLLLTEVPA